MTRKALIICLTFFATTSATAYADGDATRGEASYNNNCAGCHRVAATIAAGINSETEANGLAEVDSFLSNHYAPDADIRADIIAYLKSQDGA